MSHFTVMVRLPAEVPANELEKKIGEMLVPYCEHENDGLTEPYMTFKDTEDEERTKYETESVEKIRLPTGELVLTWDHHIKMLRLAIAHELNIEMHELFGASRDGTERIDALLRERYEHVQVAYRDSYPDFETFMKQWCGSERDKKTGRYGYWRNENAKWDWWAIGGRWRGLLLIKEPSRGQAIGVEMDLDAPLEGGLGEQSWVYSPEFHKGEVPGSTTEVDYCRISNLDWLRIETTAKERTDKFWAEMDQFLSGHEFEFHCGPRETMLSLGILTCKDADELKGDEFWKSKWAHQNRPGVDRFDVVAVKPDRNTFEARVLENCCPITTYAYLDAAGWHERGEMGWWGCSSATPESNKAHDESFLKWIKSGDQRDWIIVVDCHI